MRLVLKMLMVFGLTLALLIPLLLINGIVQDRQANRLQAVQAIARSSAGAQALAGPVLVVPYSQLVDVEEKNDKGEVVRRTKQRVENQWTFFPMSMDVTGDLKPKVKYLSIHEVRAYELQGKILADFDVVIPKDDNPDAQREIGRPYLDYGIADVRGLQGVPTLRIDGKEWKLERGLGGSDGSGLHVQLDAPAPGAEVALKTQFDFALEGTEALAVMPLAQRNRVVLSSSWKHPQFSGSFTARDRTIDEKGFKATWEVSSLASNAQKQYLSGKTLPDVTAIGLSSSYRARADGESIGNLSDVDTIGVSLVDPVNIYSQADRASKYGILFVVLTFVGFFMFELIKQLRIHPIQYGLVGLALAIFFLLLIALSEHFPFGRSYLIASAACIGLLGYYVSHVLRSWSRGLGFSAMLGTLYAALYGLLISEDNAMVLGAVLLFLILATIMVVTRKIDWYKVGAAAMPPPLPNQAAEPV